ncbi:hypothetical protein [Rhodanobacter koreensis]
MAVFRQSLPESLPQDFSAAARENSSAENEDSELVASRDAAATIRRSDEGKNAVQRDIDDHFGKNKYTKADTELHDRPFIPESMQHLLHGCRVAFSFGRAHADIL